MRRPSDRSDETSIGQVCFGTTTSMAEWLSSVLFYGGDVTTRTGSGTLNLRSEPRVAVSLIKETVWYITCTMVKRKLPMPSV